MARVCELGGVFEFRVQGDLKEGCELRASGLAVVFFDWLHCSARQSASVSSASESNFK